MLNYKRFTKCRAFVITTFVSGVLFSQYSLAEGPDSIQLKVATPYEDLLDEQLIKETQNGVFDLSNEESTFVSAATEPLKGTSPGIRTIATVNNENGKLRACSTVNINYQIIDLDGDWDSPKTYENVPAGNGLFYTHLKTSDTIEWQMTLSNSNKGLVINLNDPDYKQFLSEDKLKFKIPQMISFRGNEYSTEGATLSYKIIPYTMIGSDPAYPENYDHVVVDDLTKGKLLKPGVPSGAQAEAILPEYILKAVTDKDFNPTLAKPYLEFPGLVNPLEVGNRNFVANNIILPADPDDCIEPTPGVNVIIYDASDANKTNLIEPTAWSERKRLSVNRNYRAEVLITDANGKQRSLTKQEYEDSELPFSWNFYFSSDESCYITEATVNSTEEQGSCISKISFKEKDSDRVGAKFIQGEDGVEVLDYASIELQDTNKNSLIQNTFEGSEQGAVIAVEFGYQP